MTPHEAAAAALFVQHNAKWVDRRLSTALAWRLLNARTASDLAADGMQQGRQQWQQQHLAAQAERVAGTSCGSAAGTLTLDGAAAADASSSRQARQRTLLWGLDTARLEAWTGNTMFCTARRIPCSWQQQQQQQQQQQHQAGGVTSGGGTSGSGSDPPAAGPWRCSWSERIRGMAPVRRYLAPAAAAGAPLAAAAAAGTCSCRSTPTPFPLASRCAAGQLAQSCMQHPDAVAPGGLAMRPHPQTHVPSTKTLRHPWPLPAGCVLCLWR